MPIHSTYDFEGLFMADLPNGSKAVFVGGYNLEKLKSYASSIKFK